MTRHGGGATRPSRHQATVVGRLLWLCGPLEARDILEGMARLRRPPADMTETDLTAMLVADGRFWVSGSSVRLVDATAVSMDESTATLFEVFQPDRARVLTRAQLRERCALRGMPSGSFATMTTYHPALVSRGRNLWQLRGQPYRSVPKERRVGSSGRVVEYTWTAEGALRLTAMVTSTESYVVNVPAAVAGIISHRSFEVVGQDASHATVVRTGARQAWGVSTYLSHEGAKAGDQLVLDFDVVSSLVRLALVRSSR